MEDFTHDDYKYEIVIRFFDLTKEEFQNLCLMINPDQMEIVTIARELIMKGKEDEKN